MKVDIFTLCDSALEYNGKLVIIGTFNCIYAQQFPTIHPELALVARIIFNENEKGVHQIKFSIKKEGEEKYIMPPGEMTSDTSNAQGNETGVNVIIKGHQILIPEPGIYTISLKIGDNTWKSNLHVVQQAV